MNIGTSTNQNSSTSTNRSLYDGCTAIDDVIVNKDYDIHSKLGVLSVVDEIRNEIPKGIQPEIFSYFRNANFNVRYIIIDLN